MSDDNEAIKQHHRIKQVKRKIISNKNIKSISYNLYYFLMLLEPSTVIILTQNIRNGLYRNLYSCNFPCHIIMVNNKPIYKFKTKYKIIHKKEKDFNTILFDESSGLPVVDENENSSTTIHETNRVIHHILINVINRILVKNGMNEIEYVPRRKTNEGNLASVKLKAYPTIEKDGTISLREINELDQEYSLLKVALMNIFDEYLNKDNGKTKTLILGDSIDEIVKKESIKKYIQIGREELLQRVKEEIHHLIETNQFNLLQMTMNNGATQQMMNTVYPTNGMNQQQINQNYSDQQNIYPTNSTITTNAMGSIMPLNTTQYVFGCIPVQIPQIPNTTIRVNVQLINDNGEMVYDTSIQSHSNVLLANNQQNIMNNEMMNVNMYQKHESSTSVGFLNYVENDYDEELFEKNQKNDNNNDNNN